MIHLFRNVPIIMTFLFVLFVCSLHLNAYEFVDDVEMSSRNDDSKNEDSEDLDEDKKSSEDDEDDFKKEDKSQDEDDFKKESEADDFVKEEPAKDDFTPEDNHNDDYSKKESSSYNEDRDYSSVSGRRGRDVMSYREPDIAEVVTATYLYASRDLKSEKYFEVYVGDQMQVSEIGADWCKVTFLGKDGWIPTDHLIIDRFYSFRLILDLTTGFAFPTDSDYTLAGSHSLSALVKTVDFLYVGAEFKAINLDSDTLYAGGGAIVRAYIPWLDTKKSRTSVDLSGGYMYFPDWINLKGYYLSTSVDWLYRLTNRFYLGAGFNFTYATGSGDMTNETSSSGSVERTMYIPGLHVKMVFNTIK